MLILGFVRVAIMDFWSTKKIINLLESNIRNIPTKEQFDHKRGLWKEDFLI